MRVPSFPRLRSPLRAARRAAFILVLVALGTLAASTVARAASANGTVRSVKDGNTVVVTVKGRPVTVTLAGIRAPKGAQPFALAARLQLAGIAKAGAAVRVVAPGKIGRRVAAQVFLAGQRGVKSVNRQMVLIGFARATAGGALAAAERKARAAKRGIFGRSLVADLPLPPRWRVTGNADTVPFAPSLNSNERRAALAQLGLVYAEIDRLTFGRTLFVSNPTLGFGGATEIERFTQIDLAGNFVFERRFREFGAGFATDDRTTGTWFVTLDLSSQEGLRPTLVLEATGGIDAAGAPLPPSTRREALDLGSAGRILVGGLSFASGPL